jgi:hypothetical protein
MVRGPLTFSPILESQSFYPRESSRIVCDENGIDLQGVTADESIEWANGLTSLLQRCTHSAAHHRCGSIESRELQRNQELVEGLVSLARPTALLGSKSKLP